MMMMMRRISILELSINILSAFCGERIVCRKNVVEPLSVHENMIQATFCISIVLKAIVEKML